MNKKGRNEIEKGISLLFGLMVLFIFSITVITSGILSQILNSLTSTLGFLGFLIGLSIIIAIVAAVLEAFKKNDFF